MTLPHDLDNLARTLAHLAVTASSSELDRAGLGTALRARREILGLFREVLTEVAPGGSTPTARTAVGVPTVADLQVDPVAVLSRAVADHPAPRAPWDDTRPSEVFGPGHTQPWNEAGRHALLARQGWSGLRDPFSDAQRWSAVADVAALAQTLAVIDVDLLRAAGRPPTADRELLDALAAASSSGLRLAAAEVLQLAEAGDLPSWGEPGCFTGPAGVLVVGSAVSLNQGHARLPAQIRRAEHLSPPAVGLLLSGQARALATAALALRATDPQRAERAAQLSQQLRVAVPPSRHLAALMPDDPRPVAQTRELLRHLATVSAADQLYHPALAAIIDRAPVVVQTLASTAQRSMNAGEWLVPDTDEPNRPNAALWRLARPTDRPPQLLRTLDAITADNLAAANRPPAPSARSAPPAARDTLAGITAARAVRPANPSKPPDLGRE